MLLLCIQILLLYMIYIFKLYAVRATVINYNHPVVMDYFDEDRRDSVPGPRDDRVCLFDFADKLNPIYQDGFTLNWT